MLRASKGWLLFCSTSLSDPISSRMEISKKELITSCFGRACVRDAASIYRKSLPQSSVRVAGRPIRPRVPKWKPDMEQYFESRYCTIRRSRDIRVGNRTKLPHEWESNVCQLLKLHVTWHCLKKWVRLRVVAIKNATQYRHHQRILVQVLSVSLNKNLTQQPNPFFRFTDAKTTQGKDDWGTQGILGRWQGRRHPFDHVQNLRWNGRRSNQ